MVSFLLVRAKHLHDVGCQVMFRHQAGRRARSKQQPRRRRVCQVGGKYLGKISIPTKIDSVFGAVRELQRQGAKLLPHRERPCEYLVIQLDQVELPLFDVQQGERRCCQRCASFGVFRKSYEQNARRLGVARRRLFCMELDRTFGSS